MKVVLLSLAAAVAAGGCCEPQQYKCCTTSADCCTNWGKLECSVGVCVFSADSPRVAVESLSEQHSNSVGRKGWTATRRAAKGTSLRLTVALKQSNVEQLTALLHAVSDPESPTYGEFLSRDEVHDLTAPSADTKAVVRAWLGAAAVDATPNGDFVTLDTTVGEAEKLLAAEYWTFTHAASGRTVTRLAAGISYSLPEAVAGAIDFVAPTTTFPPVVAKPVASALRAHAGVKPVITPPKLRALANLSATDIGVGSKGIKQGVASFLGQYYDPADLAALRSKYSMTPIGDLMVPVPASQAHTPVGVEASMDVQYLTSTGEAITTEHWSTKGAQPGNPENEPFVAWLTAVAAAFDPPSLFSISYGDEESGVSFEYAQRCSVEFQKAGARGISLFAASGDGGVGCGTNGFEPTFPASCPYVTGVGAVTGGTPGSSPTGEGVADLSGGGFSNYFARPAYQDDAVKHYLSTGSSLPDQKNWNATGAGFPDISAQGILFDVCTENFFYPYSGTSAACPSATGVMATLAQQRLDNNMTKLGWLNPFFYKVGAVDAGVNAFNDVTDGVNVHCGDDTGFSAAKGWDPVSGWGTLNYGKMKPLVLAAGQSMTAAKFGRGYTYDAAAAQGAQPASHAEAFAQLADAPTSVDWRDHGAVSPVRNQGEGETCWAFSTAGAVEGAMVVKGGLKTIEPASPQYWIDCMNVPCANSSGTPDMAFAWAQREHNGSVYSWKSYPYVDSSCIFWDPPHDCLSNGTLVGTKTPVSGYSHTQVANETDLMLASAQQPVSVAIFSSLGTFTTYTGGVYYDKGCESVTADMLDHAVLLVGYGTEGDDDYWIVKNSWGPKWGENGYIRMKRNVQSGSGLCGIAIDASYPNIGY